MHHRWGLCADTVDSAIWRVQCDEIVAWLLCSIPARHGDMHLPVGIVPGNSEAKVSRALPILRCLIVGVQCVQQVLCMFFFNVFDTKIINTEGKGDTVDVGF